MVLELMASLSSELKNLGPWKKKTEQLLNVCATIGLTVSMGISSIVRVELIVLGKVSIKP